jgi:isoquinoline 1-oxidoreductase subunit beta
VARAACGAPLNARLDRRQFIVLAAAGAGVLALGFVPGLRRRVAALTRAAVRRPTPWLTIEPTGRARLAVPFTELGQGTLLGITQLVAEELDLPLAAFTTVTAPMESRFLIKDSFYTGGSGSIRPLFDDWRRLGAHARGLLLAAGAERFGVAARDCRTDAGSVVHPNGRDRIGYGALAEAAASRPLPAEVSLKPRGDWCCIGTSPARPELPTLVDGSATYGIDTRLPGQLVATLAHAPTFGARLLSVDPAPALAMPGVRAVVPLAAAVAVAGDTFWHASQGLAALAPRWDSPAGTAPDSAALEAQLVAALDGTDFRLEPADREAPASAYRARVEAAFAAAPARFEATYSGPLLAHSTLEPQNTLAVVADGRVELYSPTQHQSNVQTQVAQALGVRAEQVVVHTTRIGGGFGRRLKADYAVEAALVARAVGKPVQLLWSRREDLQHDFYRPAAAARMSAGLDAKGLPVAVRARSVATGDTLDGGLHGEWYRLDPCLVEVAEFKSPIPVGAWRSVDASLSCFFVESFVDELAARAGTDPLAYRLALAEPRTRRVLEAAAEHARWGTPGRCLGIAAFSGWNTFVAQVAEVERDAGGRPRVARITCAFDCGTAVNPALVRAQVEGGITMGLSAALKERITLARGGVVEQNFDGYPLLRMPEAPAIEVILLASEGAPVGGAGEPPVPAVAPAVANALYRLTGVRQRSLPLARA